MKGMRRTACAARTLPGRRPWPRPDAASTIWVWRWILPTRTPSSGSRSTAGSMASSCATLKEGKALRATPMNRSISGMSDCLPPSRSMSLISRSRNMFPCSTQNRRKFPFLYGLVRCCISPFFVRIILHAKLGKTLRIQGSRDKIRHICYGG